MKKNFRITTSDCVSTSARLVYTGRRPDGSRPMDDYIAWLISVAKWEMISEFHQANPQSTLHTGQGDTCGFCMLHKRRNGTCRPECPVYEYTGVPGCIGTPHDIYMNDPCARTARLELEFIRSLEK